MEAFRKVLSHIQSKASVYKFLETATEEEAYDALKGLLDKEYDIIYDMLFAHLPQNMVTREVKISFK